MHLLSRRRYGFYLYKVVLINMLLTIWSWVMFWMDVTEFADRMNVVLTLFLANVAFLFVISDKLPKVQEHGFLITTPSVSQCNSLIIG